MRKLTGKSVKHWFITELGHEKTERLHLHGIVWGLGNGKKITDNWKYGITFTGYFVNEKTINYITKYILKIDEKHPKFRGKVLCSAGIGAGYLKREDAKRHVYTPGKTNAYFLTLTIDDKSYKQLKQKYELKDNNDIATKAIRLCLERVRKLTCKYRDWETGKK